MGYSEISLDVAYRLLNTGPVVMVCTVSQERKYDVAPIAWACPANKEPAQVLLGIGQEHKTFLNIEETRVFVAGVPHISQVEMIKAAGSVSGGKVDKFAHCGIESVQGEKVDARIPLGMIGFVECQVKQIFDTGELALVVGEAVYAAADPAAFDGQRLLSETAAGKTVHHLGNKVFVSTGDEIFR